nr:helix-turn-helix transcriptional regulator [Micromonospora sp. DSM 115978]
MAEHAVTLRAQWIGQQLREMRERASLTLKDVGDYINRNASTVSRLESGIIAPRVPEVLAYLDLCGIDDARRRADLKTMAQDAWQKGWWEGFAADVAGSLIDWVWLESRATRIQSFQIAVLPGLLQTREYAETVIRAAHQGATDEQITRFVDLRMARQRQLDSDDPIKLSTIIDEGALRRLVGGAEVMRAQLDHLSTSADLPNVEVMILPSSTGAHASPNGAFDVFQMRRPYPYTGCVSTPTGTVVVEGEKAEKLVATYDRLRGSAICDDAARRFLYDLTARLE